MPDLTDAMIAEGMARAERAVCGTLHDRCWGFPHGLDHARQTCDAKGRCCIGWVTRGGRETWDAWLDTTTGEGRLRRWSEGW